MTYNREVKCFHGVIKAGGYGPATKMGGSLMAGQRKWAVIRPTPQAWAITMIGGCIVGMFW